MFDSWMMLLRDYGTMKLRRRADARDFVRARTAIRWSSAPRPRSRPSRKLFREHWPTSAAVYLPNGKVPEAGTLFTNKTMAATYTRVLKEAESAGADRVAQIEKARKVWSQGFVAEAIDKFCRTQAVMDTSGKPHSGVLTGQDMAKLAGARSTRRSPTTTAATPCARHRGARGQVTLQQLALLKGFNLDGMDVVGPDFIHLVVECSEARLRRPREVLRRSELRRGAVRDAALGRLQRRATQARRPTRPRSNCGRARSRASARRR